MSGLSDAEQVIEDLARTVPCPNCGAQPPRACRIWLEPQGKWHGVQVACTGRLMVARGQT